MDTPTPRSEEHDSITLAPALANALAASFARLAQAKTDEELLAAAVGCVEPMGTIGATLMVSTAFGAGDRPSHGRVVAQWIAGMGMTPPMMPEETDLATLEASRLWWGQSEPLFFEDIANDPRADKYLIEATAANGVRAQVMLPLHSDAVGKVIGVVLFYWPHVRRFSAEERYVFKILTLGLGSFLASRRLLAAQDEALRAAERQRRTLNAVIENLPVGVYLAEANTGKPLLANQLGINMLGRSGKDNTGKPYYEAYTILRPGTEETVPMKELPLFHTLSTGEPRIGTVDVLRDGDGARLTLELSAAPVRDESGAMFAAVVVYADVTERNRAETERAEIREELIRTQAQALAERSTPLVPLSEEVVAMPIVGTLDASRADQIVEALLTGCSARKARFAILDVTGVPHADTSIAAALLRAASAVRLLGVEPILTGVRPDVARTLTSLDIDLRGLVTLSTLQEGIAYAASRARKATRARAS